MLWLAVILLLMLKELALKLSVPRLRS
jgi:hypothetical protein